MDYFATPLAFRIRKTLRYAGLYGLRRTYVKVAGQYHMRRKYKTFPKNHRPSRSPGNVAIIGCGNFAFTVIAHYLTKRCGKVIRACMDVNEHHAASMCDYYDARYYTTDLSEVLADPEVTLVFVASNHASHADYAIQAIRAGKDVHIEKPHVVRDDQLLRLCEAMMQSDGRVLSIGYNRPGSTLGLRIRAALAKEAGDLMQSWFIAGHQIQPDHWYFSEAEGGRVLGNLCHWIDFAYQVMPAERLFPIVINPTRSLKSDCDIAVTYTFGDGSIAALTFSAKGHAFEGVKERYAAHRGNVLVAMDDFQSLRIDDGENTSKCQLRVRDHGHEAAIMGSYEKSLSKTAPGCSVSYVWQMGQLILQTKKALEAGQQVTVASAQPSDTDFRLEASLPST
jgi:predicted dehydrogenase